MSLIIPIVNMISVSVPKENTAVGLGMNTMLRNLGGAVGPVLATTIISTYSDKIGPPILPTVMTFGNKTAFNLIFALGIVLKIIIIALSLTIKNYTFHKTKMKT